MGVTEKCTGIRTGNTQLNHDGDSGDEETSTDPFHMVSNRVVGMVCHRRSLNACVFGGTKGASLRMRGNRRDHTHPNHRGPKPESRGMRT